LYTGESKSLALQKTAQPAVKSDKFPDGKGTLKFSGLPGLDDHASSPAI
jgi:hypothetical protein